MFHSFAFTAAGQGSAGFLRRHARLFLGLLAIYTLVFGLFLQEHWVHDAYLVALTGYGRMPGPLWSQGRVFSALLYRALEALSVPYAAAMAGSVFCSLVFLALAVLVIYDGSEALRAGGRAGQAVALLGGCALVFNLFVPEFFLFYETAVMSLGIFLAVMAACVLARAERIRSYCSGFLLLTASVFCYQAVGAFFLPLVIYFLTAQGARVWKKIVRAGVMYGAACFSNLLFLRFVPADVRAGGVTNLAQNLARCVKLLGSLLYGAFGFLPAGVFLVLLCASVTALVWACVRAQQYKPLLAALLSCAALIVCALLPLLALASDHWYAVPRAVVALAGLPGVPLLFLPRAGRWHAALALALVLVFTAAQVDLQVNNRKNNALDAAEVGQIATQINDHEAVHGSLARVEVTYDASPLYYRADLRAYGDATIRILAVSWMPYPVLSHALDARCPVWGMPEDTARRLFGGKNWDALHPDQFVFEGDVLYLCLY